MTSAAGDFHLLRGLDRAIRAVRGRAGGGTGETTAENGRPETPCSLREREESFARAFQCSPVPMCFSVLESGAILEVNDEFVRLSEFSRAEIIGRTTIELGLWLDPFLRSQAGEVITRTGRVRSMPTKFRARSGRLLDCLFSAESVLLGGVPCLISSIMDCTELKRREEALRRSDQLLSLIAENVQDIIWIMDCHTLRLSFISPSVTRMRGFTVEEALAQSVDDMLTPASRDRALSMLRTELARGEIEDLLTRTVDLEQFCADGSTIWTENTVTLVRDEQGAPAILLGVTRDVTERRKTEETLVRIALRLEEAERLAQTGSASYELGTHKLELSAEAARILGFEPGETHRDHALLERVHPEDFPRLGAALRRLTIEGTLFDEEVRVTHRDGSEHWVHALAQPRRDSTGRIDAVFGTTQDVTEHKRAEAERELLREQLQQAMKMEAVGRLAGGVAHDFNNILTGIQGYVDVLLDPLSADDPMRADLGEIQGGVERAVELTRQLLAFSRKQMIAPMVLDVNEVVERSRRMLGRIIGEDILLQFLPGPTLGSVRADPGQLEQILVNLAVNSRDAMPHGGELTIETGNVTFDETSCRGNAEARPGAWVVLRVSDNGAGMDETTLRHLFEPFFTTKPQGQGTGLGLATVYGIVKQNGGFITVESEAGKGSTFRVYLPCVAESPERAATVLPAVPCASGETLLLVEDEAMVRNLARRILERAGYRVLTATNGGEALLICESHEGPIHLLLTDVVMPLMNGRDLYARLLQARPSLKVLYMSGYTEEVIAHHGVLDPNVEFLQKPFTVEGLTRRVRGVLDDKDR